MYCILVTIDDTDIPGQAVILKNTLETLVEGRDAENIEGEIIFNRYVLLGTETDVRIWVGFDTNRLAGTVRNDLEQTTTLYRVIDFREGTRDFAREDMIRLAKIQMGPECDHIWILKPGDAIPPGLTGDSLLAMFEPFAVTLV